MNNPAISQGLSELQLQQFMHDGYLVLRGLAPGSLRKQMIDAVETAFGTRVEVLIPIVDLQLIKYS